MMKAIGNKKLWNLALSLGVATLSLSAEAKRTVTTTTTTLPSTQSTWTRCASENGTCSFTYTREVRYGANGIYTSKILTAPVACNNTTFGDPVPGVTKACDYSSVIQSTSTTTTTTLATTTTTTTTNTTTTTTTIQNSGTRDKFKQPFAVNSIWNMPIGSAAQYVPANLKAVPGDVVQWMQMPYSDDDVIILRPTAPLTNIMYSNAGWSNTSRCGYTQNSVLAQVPIPADYVAPSNVGNMGAAILMPDGRTIVQSQPFARCSGYSYATSWFRFPDVDIYGDGIRGAHGGSGMSAIGGTIRVGELRPEQQGPRHAIKLVIYMKEAYKCLTASTCFRWPAVSADADAVGRYGTGTNNPNVNNAAMVMGSLLAIPTSVSIANLGLETEPARQLAWTLQNYGGYVVDDTGAAQFAIPTEIGPDGSFQDQFKADYGFNFTDNLLDNSPWRRDIQRLITALYVVNNNSATSIGGGGTPLQPLAAPIGN